MGIIIKKYGDLTTPTPAYGGKVYQCFSPSKWLHFLCDKDGKNLIPLSGVTGVLKKAIDKSQPLMRWAVKLALTRARALMLAQGLGPDGAIQLFESELDAILKAAKSADAEVLEDAGQCGHQAHEFIDRVCKSILANDEKKLVELLATWPDDERACNGAIAALSFFVAHNVRVIKSEFRCLSLEHKCCGTGDSLALVDSCGDPACCSQQTPFFDRLSYLDFKTSNGLYISYLFQASIYVKAHEEEFPERGEIVDRWILRLDKETAEFDPWHAEGREAHAEDLHGYLCCLNLVRAMDVTQARVDAILDARKAIDAERKACEKLERDKVRCPKADDYKGVRLTKCLPDGTQCEACKQIYEVKHLTVDNGT
jgi:hypothetical protein